MQSFAAAKAIEVRLRREFDLWPFVEALIHDLHPVAETGSTRLINSVPEDFVVYADAVKSNGFCKT